MKPDRFAQIVNQALDEMPLSELQILTDKTGEENNTAGRLVRRQQEDTYRKLQGRVAKLKRRLLTSAERQEMRNRAASRAVLQSYVCLGPILEREAGGTLDPVQLCLADPSVENAAVALDWIEAGLGHAEPLILNMLKHWRNGSTFRPQLPKEEA